MSTTKPWLPYQSPSVAARLQTLCGCERTIRIDHEVKFIQVKLHGYINREFPDEYFGNGLPPLEDRAWGTTRYFEHFDIRYERGKQIFIYKEVRCPMPDAERVEVLRGYVKVDPE